MNLLSKFKKVIVTSALPYVNNVPHLGNLVCIISADVYTRYLRWKGVNVICILGTDEHGTTTEFKAKEENLTPKEICDKYYRLHKKIYDFFLCSFDCFGRTSSKENHEITKEIFLKLYKNGYISEGEVDQLYCNKCHTFLPDRFVVGTCPKCGYENARGDQCENCGTLLDPTDLIDPRCAFCGTKPVIKRTKHLFLDLDKLQPEIERYVEERKEFWTENAINMTYSWLKKGLKKRCITRDLKWGIKVPLKGYENKVFYSWFDAPIGYIGITKECREDWYQFWHDDKHVLLVQFMGKDNIPFHTILFPAYLIGTKDNYTLMRMISVNEYLNYENLKFSKSKGTGIFGDDIMQMDLRPDVWRYYLMINRPEKSDTFFTWKDFQAKVNNELVANLGNFVNRVLTFVHKFYNNTLEDCNNWKKEFDSFFNKVKKNYEKIDSLLEKANLKDALKEIMKVSKIGNQFFQESRLWELFNNDKEKCNTYLLLLVNLVKDLSILTEPFMPGVSKDIKDMLNLKELSWNDLGRPIIRPNSKIKKPKLLFRKIDDKEIQLYSKRFSGGNMNFEILCLKVGVIEDVRDHPNADRLYVLKVDLGNEKRQLVAGLKKYYKKEELINKHVVVITNLKKAILRGIESQGMLLAGVKGDNVKILEAPNSKPGSIVYIKDKKCSNKEIDLETFYKLGLKVKEHKVYFRDFTLKTDYETIHCDLAEGDVR